MAVPTEHVIFVTADEPLLIFSSAGAAAAWLEWPDVEDGLYRGLDGLGRPVRFSVEIAIEPRRFRRSGREVKSVVCEVGSEPTEADELRGTLIRVLSDQDDLAGWGTMSLDDLRTGALERFGVVS